MAAWTDEDIARATAMRDAGKTYHQIGSDLRRSANSVRHLMCRLGKQNMPSGPSEGIEINGSDSSQVITCRSTTIRTLEAALIEAKVDREIWEDERHVINKWDIVAKGKDGMIATELWQVKVWLKRKHPYAFATAMDAVLAKISEKAPKYPPLPKRKVTDPIMVEISLCDVHFGKLAWAAETGSNYDLKIARAVWKNAIEDILALVDTQQIERFLFVVGNDFFHFDNMASTTTAGTPQDADGRYPKVIQTGFEGLTWAIDLLGGMAPVDITLVPGNHDYLASYHIVRELKAWYRHAKHITVDDGPSSRKYVRYGCSLLGFTHGNDEKHDRLPSIMATEAKELWAATTHHEWHLGHRHISKATSHQSVDTHEGCVVRILPSLTGVDSWHFKKGYIGRRAAEAYLWHKARGYLGHFSVNVRE